MAADPLTRIAEICHEQPHDALTQIAAVLGMDKVEAQRDALRAALEALTAEADHFKFVVLKPQLYSDRCTKHRAQRYLSAVEAAGRVLHAHGVNPVEGGQQG